MSYIWQLLGIAKSEGERVHELLLMEVRFEGQVRGREKMVIATRRIQSQRETGNCVRKGG